MIVVSVHQVDGGTPAAASHNGGYALHFYNLAEAYLYAQSESLPQEGGSLTTQSWSRVYNDGIMVAQYVGGTAI